ncbi:hypothetical protein [Pedobacter zeae]|uniref:Uncharacterized protein n=1 Tax=Pedobacter zeae TaxID=1737356 RepID=A0A7W6K7K4_9SPHI|nr:hypothetical protein [Pedobacter zeae]MBB4106646.1 hypothetical protein [Pedobacter zeae]
MKKTKKQKRFESKHWGMYGFQFYNNLPPSKNRRRIEPKRFRMAKFRGLILGLIARKKCDFLGAGSCSTRGICYDYGRNKIGIYTSIF